MFLSLPPLVLLLLALRKLAPTQLTIAGFAARILSGGLAATAYGLHCPERSVRSPVGVCFGVTCRPFRRPHGYDAQTRA